MVGPEDDLTLAERISAGDKAALETLYERYADPLYAFICHQLSGTPADTDDIWQNTLLAAIRSLPRYRGSSGLFTWLCGIARHKVADHLRCRGQMPVVFSEMSVQQLAVIIDKSSLPEESLMQLDTRIGVVEALAALPEDYRTALVARYADQRTVDEVAQLLGKTYKAAESLLCRARIAFRTVLLHEDMEGHDEQ